MKKTLVALAALAATGAFAQVTLTGNVTMGYEANTTGGVNGVGATDASGLGTDTTAITFAASEDMGGGYKAAIKMTMDNINRSGNVAGQDASLSLTTPVGQLTLATAKAADYLSGGLASVGSYYSGWDDKVFGSRTSRDTITFAVPFGNFTGAVTYQEAGTGLGLGAGTSGTAGVTGQSLTGVSISYAAGAANANLTWLSFNSNAGALKDQARLSGNYDLGVAKLGAGYVNTNVAGTSRITDMEIAANVPMGAAYMGVSWVSRKYDDFGATSGTATGYSLEVGYNMSKRTAVIANYARWTQTQAGLGGVTAGRDASGKTQVLLSHSF